MDYANSGNSRTFDVPKNASYGAISVTSQGLQVPSESPVRDAISAAEQLASEVHECIGRLESRLETVTTPIPPQPAMDRNQASAGRMVSHVKGRLDLLNEGLMEATVRLRALCGRIEL